MINPSQCYSCHHNIEVIDGVCSKVINGKCTGYQSCISEFRLSYSWLSNFYPCKITIGKIEFPTTEHAYQAMKTTDLNIRHEISLLSTPGRAKRFGQALPLLPDWDEDRLIWMDRILRLKFNIPEFRILLIRTYPAILEEGNYWKDTFWGICPPRSGKGQNHLGKIQMMLRDELRRGRFLWLCSDERHKEDSK